MLQQTSILSYRSIEDTLGKRQEAVLNVLRRIQPACNRAIAEAANLPINSITPRIGELRAKGKVIEAYRDTDITGRKAIFWKVEE